MGVDGLLGDGPGVFLVDVAASPQIRLRLAQIGLGGFQIRLVVPRVQARQHLALHHLVAFPNVELDDTAADLEPQVGVLVGADAAGILPSRGGVRLADGVELDGADDGLLLHHLLLAGGDDERHGEACHGKTDPARNLRHARFP